MLALLASLGDNIPATMVSLSIASAIGKLAAGDVRGAVYWFSAAALNYAAAGYRLPRLPWAS
ncbi:MAG: hypothetical protein AAB214_17555 [Fibrobacterota bacterium]